MYQQRQQVISEMEKLKQRDLEQRRLTESIERQRTESENRSKNVETQLKNREAQLTRAEQNFAKRLEAEAERWEGVASSCLLTTRMRLCSQASEAEPPRSRKSSRAGSVVGTAPCQRWESCFAVGA